MGNESLLGSDEVALTWSCVEEGFYVASVGVLMVGFIDQIEPALFEVCDSRARVLGLFDRLETAMGRLSEAGITVNADPQIDAHGAAEEPRDEQ